MEKILVLDFGGQYDQLIARRVREHHVYAEVKPYNKVTLEEIRAGYVGVIFTGGPNSVYDPASPHYDPAILGLGLPILGICYGDQLMAYMAGGEIRNAENSSEYGKVEVTVDPSSPLFFGVPEKSVCWMSHNDFVSTPPKGFRTVATTEKCPCAAMSDESRKLYGVQFHPEVTHTACGKQILHNFLFRVCGCAGDWNMEDFIEKSIETYRRELAGKRVLCALSHSPLTDLSMGIASIFPLPDLIGPPLWTCSARWFVSLDA